MKKLLQYRIFVAITLIVGCHFFIFQKSLRQSFGESYFVYSIGVFATILISSVLIKKNNFLTWLCWSIFAPVAGSILGYTALFLLFICEVGHYFLGQIFLWDLIKAVTCDAYLVANLWIISLIFLCLFYINSWINRVRINRVKVK
jgi:hypothetical protein